MAVIGTRFSRSVDAGAGVSEGAGGLTCAWTFSFRTTPCRPVPAILLASTPSSVANRRAAGESKGSLFGDGTTGAAAGAGFSLSDFAGSAGFAGAVVVVGT